MNLTLADYRITAQTLAFLLSGVGLMYWGHGRGLAWALLAVALLHIVYLWQRGSFLIKPRAERLWILINRKKRHLDLIQYRSWLLEKKDQPES